MSSAVARYQRTESQSWSRPEMLLALLDGAIRFTKEARVAIEKRDFATKGEATTKAMAVVTELEASLDHARAPEVCAGLARIYAFVRERLLLASVKLDVKASDHAIKQLVSLRASFAEAMSQGTGQ